MEDSFLCSLYSAAESRKHQSECFNKWRSKSVWLRLIGIGLRGLYWYLKLHGFFLIWKSVKRLRIFWSTYKANLSTTLQVTGGGDNIIFRYVSFRYYCKASLFNCVGILYFTHTLCFSLLQRSVEFPWFHQKEVHPKCAFFAQEEGYVFLI